MADRVLGFTEIARWLRQQHPMIYIDRVLHYEPGEHLRSTLLVSGTMPCIAGHLPDRAIFPGSYLIHAFAQSGTILFQVSTSMLEDDEHIFLGSVHSRFRRPVVVGDQVIFDVRADRLLGNTLHFSARATVGNTPVASLRGALVRVRDQERP